MCGTRDVELRRVPVYVKATSSGMDTQVASVGTRPGEFAQAVGLDNIAGEDARRRC